MPRLKALSKQAESATFKDELISYAKHSPGWSEPTAKSFCYLIFISEFQFPHRFYKSLIMQGCFHFFISGNWLMIKSGFMMNA